LVHHVTAIVHSDSNEAEEDDPIFQTPLALPAYPTFSKEPRLCRLSVRLPDGRLCGVNVNDNDSSGVYEHDNRLLGLEWVITRIGGRRLNS
jgi:hypothetical protein